MEKIPKYKDFINKGVYNKVLHLDDDWIIKSPLSPSESEDDGFNNMKEVLKKFKEHIDTMKKYPDIFPKVIKLDRYRAAIEKLDTEEAKKQIKHIYYYLYDEFSKRVAYDDFFTYLMFEEGNDYLEILKEGDDTCKKWYAFMKKILNSPLYKGIGNYLDIHEDNIGIDKQGNIKLLDF